MNELKYQYKYPRPSVTTDCVIFGMHPTDGLFVLLIQRGNEPYKGCWAFPGGFLEMTEDAETGARRELYEETGLRVPSLKQLGAFTQVDRDPRDRVISIAYYGLVTISDVCGGDDAAEAKWFPINELPSLAFDHRQIFDQAIKTLREQLSYAPVGIDVLKAPFTAHELVSLYQCILGKPLNGETLLTQLTTAGILFSAKEMNKNYPEDEPTFRFNQNLI